MRELEEGALALGIALDDEARRRFAKLSKLILEANGRMNLISHADEGRLFSRHFADSLSPLAAAKLPAGASVIDVGCGAGFPGLPMKIIRPDLRLTFLDSTAKKLDFVRSAVSALGFEADFLSERAEEAGRRPELRESFDAAVSRGVAGLFALAEVCLPFVRVGGVFLAVKGEQAARELSDAEENIAALGGRAAIFESGAHAVVVTEKKSATPAKFPRRWAMIIKAARK